MAIASADFHSSGIDPLSKDLLKRILRGIASCLLSSFNTLGGTWSGPNCALFGFNLFSLSCQDCLWGYSYISWSYIIWPFSHLNMGHIIRIFSFMCKNTRKKVTHNICFFCFRYSHNLCPSSLLRGLYLYWTLPLHIFPKIFLVCFTFFRQ